MATLTIADLDNGKRDLETVDAVANSSEDTAITRYGDSVLTLAGALRRLGYKAPVAYASGLNVDSALFTVSHDGVIYAPDPSLVPFTTGAWDAAQWRPVQNTANTEQIFGFEAKSEADAAAAILPEGSAVEVFSTEKMYRVASGGLEFSHYTGQAAFDAIVGLSSDGIANGAAVIAKGRDSAGDGGGGVFTYYATSTQPADGGIIFAPTEGIGRFIRDGWTVFGFSGEANVRWFGAKLNGIADDYAHVQAALNSCLNVHIPETAGDAYCKILTTLKLRSGAKVTGVNREATVVGAWGCDAFTLDAGVSNVTIDGMELRAYSSLGVVDSRQFSGVSCQGVKTSNCNYVTLRNLYMRGWDFGVDWKYSWYSLLDNVKTINTNNGVRLFGQCVNNYITNCGLECNGAGGNASVITMKDTDGSRGEGLMITGTLMAWGKYGITSDGFLSMNVIGCTIDLIEDTAIDLLNVPSFMLSSSWVYAKNNGVRYNYLSVPVKQGGSITGSYITVTASDGKCVYVLGNNIGVAITGGSLTCGEAGRLVHVDGSGVSVVGVHGVNTGSLESIFFNGDDCVERANTGNMGVNWYQGVPSQKGNAVATAMFVGSTGAVNTSYFCSVSRTGVGAYSVTFQQPLKSAAYAPIIVPDASGQNSVGVRMVSQTTSGFSFITVNQSGSAIDPTNLFLSVFN